MGSIAKLAMTDAKPSGKSRRCMGEVYVYGQNIDTHTRRRTAAEAVDEDIFSQFCMYHVAGLSDFSFMQSVQYAVTVSWSEVLQVPGSHEDSGEQTI